MRIQSVYHISELGNDPLRVVGKRKICRRKHEGWSRTFERYEKKTNKKRKKSRVTNAMASKEYYMESHHLMLARNIFKNSVSKTLPA